MAKNIKKYIQLFLTYQINETHVYILDTSYILIVVSLFLHFICDIKLSNLESYV